MLCDDCAAELWLTPEDWELIGFYKLVSDQYVNHAPMGVQDGAPPVASISMANIKAALEVYDVPREKWSWYSDNAKYLFRVANRIEKVRGVHELPIEDLLDGHED